MEDFIKLIDNTLDNPTNNIMEAGSRKQEAESQK